MRMSLRTLFILVGCLYLFEVSHGAQLIIENHCKKTIWPATLTSAQKPQLSTTGFELAPGQTRTIDVPTPWNGRIWARTYCGNHDGRWSCKSGDCASGSPECRGAGGIPPASLVEINIAANGGQDFYDISLVDGYNLPVSVDVRGGRSTGDRYSCKKITCLGKINSVCPNELSVKHDGKTVACKSACLAFNERRYCCGGLQPEQCPPTHYSKIFKDKCPDAYSYAYDDKTSTFTCFGGPSYIIKFCSS